VTIYERLRERRGALTSVNGRRI